MSLWTQHRFSSGALALDLANTVVWKDDPTRCFDRLATNGSAKDFASAAEKHCFERPFPGKLASPRDRSEHSKLIALRNAVDDWLRPLALGVQDETSLAPLFKACWAATVDCHASHLLHACALSAMQFFQPDVRDRVKVCPACRWLFLDRSKNQSRRWCDMKVCGNRAKAHQHYASHKKGLAA
jgi:predicted RNA-binding Zn ribbon-like protein